MKRNHRSGLWIGSDYISHGLLPARSVLRSAHMPCLGSMFEGVGAPLVSLLDPDIKLEKSLSVQIVVVVGWVIYWTCHLGTRVHVLLVANRARVICF